MERFGEQLKEYITRIRTRDTKKLVNDNFLLGGQMVNTKTAIVVMFSIVLFSGCSVGMALSGKKDPNLGAIRTGTTRGEVELQLGSPVKSVTTQEGRRIDIYEYEIGNEPSAGRAVGHAALDVLTLGIWEIAGTPIEAFQGKKYEMTITYSKDDKVEAINSAVVTKKEITNENSTLSGTQ